LGRLLAISAAVHVVLLIAVPLIPGLSRDYDLGLDVYAVELVDIPAEAPAVVPVPSEPEPVEEAVISEPAPEEVEEEAEIPEDPPPRPKRVVIKPPPAEPERTLADRLADRLKEQDASRPAEQPRAESTQRAPAQTSRATVAASRFPYGWYLSIVQGKVSSNWDQPSARLIGEDALTVVVSFRIRRDGSAEAISVRRSSGRSTVDRSASKAVSESVPFPPLPDDYLEDRLDVTIDFTITRD
jgi:TonB family protein